MLLILRFTAVFDTTSPAAGRCFWTAAGFTASRESHPRQDRCRPPSCLSAGLDGSIIIPDAVLAIHQPPRLALWTDGPASTLIIGRHLIKADRAAESNRTEKSDFVSSPRFYRWSSRILQRRLPLVGHVRKVSRTSDMKLSRFSRRENYPPTTKPKKSGGCTKLFFNF